MNLTDIAKKILKEDSWGNKTSDAGGMSLGRTPTAVQPPPAQSGNIVDISQSFRNFKLELEKQEDVTIKKFTEQLKKQFLKKIATVKASKGSIGQIEKEYTITVTNVETRYMKDKYYVVFVGKEGNAGESEYYLDDSQIKVNPATSQTSAGAQQSALKNVGGVIPMQPSNQPVQTAKNILPQG